MKKIINYFNQFPYQIFITDTAGALASTVFLLLIYCFDNFFGVSKNDILVLIVGSSLLVVYSFVCFLLKPKRRSLFLKILATANLLYCLFTSCIFIKGVSTYTFWAILYFLIEILVIIFLVSIEFKIANQKKE